MSGNGELDAALAALAEAGVYNPAAEDANDRRDLIALALVNGASIDEIVAAVREHRLQNLSIEHVILPGARLPAGEVAELTGLHPEVVRRFWRALGFPDSPTAGRPHVEGDVELLAFFRDLAAVVGTEGALAIARPMGTAMASIAESEVSFLRHSYEERLREASIPTADRTEGYARMGEDLLPRLNRVLDAIHRHYLVVVGRRYEQWDVPTTKLNVSDLVVGFADLSGSTDLALRLDLAGFEEAMHLFDERTSNLVAMAGATLVKRIGDAVMFVTPDPQVAGRLALDLAAEFVGDPVVPLARVGLAGGEVVARRGDFFGPAVNLAARLVAAARPGEALVSSEIAVRLGPSPRAVPAGRRALAGFGEVKVFALVGT